MQLTGRNPTFRKQRSTSNPYRVMALLTLLVISLFLLRAVETEKIESPFLPTAVPTRSAESFALEGETHFFAGNLDAAIAAFQQAVALAPDDAALWSEMARIQVYSSTLQITDEEKANRLAEALASIDRAIAVAPDDSTSHAVRAFVLSWYSSPDYVGENASTMLTEAEQEAVQALTIDNQNTLALAYYAEVLTDQGKWNQADQYIRQALERDATLMDVHRVNAYVQESLGYYGDAITSLKLASEITPNLTFLLIRIGVNYRQLKQYDQALEYFSKAATINEQLGIQDPIPYIAIGKTYAQIGEFFIASRNMQKALRFNPYNADIYGQLGMVYFKSRNYESAIPALQCAVRGCDAEISCDVRECDPSTDPSIQITGLPLSGTTVTYYFTYGSVLAGMHRPFNDYCSEAVIILDEVRAGFSQDETIMQIVEASEQVCASFGITR